MWTDGEHIKGDNKSSPCFQRVPVSFVLHDVITHHNTRSVFHPFYN